MSIHRLFDLVMIQQVFCETVIFTSTMENNALGTSLSCMNLATLVEAAALRPTTPPLTSSLANMINPTPSSVAGMYTLAPTFSQSVKLQVPRNGSSNGTLEQHPHIILYVGRHDHRLLAGHDDQIQSVMPFGLRNVSR